MHTDPAPLYIVKIGGNVIDNPEATRRFLAQFAALPGNKILVHGGGKVATQVAEKLGIPTRMVEGRRITDQAMLEVVTMVYGGLVNKNIVAKLQALGCPALGLTGADAGCILAKKREVKQIDYGYAGDIVAVNQVQIGQFISQGLVPVFAPLTYDADGYLLNTNADTIAATLGTAMAPQFPTHVVYCFEKKGVLTDPADDSSVISTISYAEYQRLKEKGIVSQGMIPKLDNAFNALQAGVRTVTIGHADEISQLAGSQMPRRGTTLYVTL